MLIVDALKTLYVAMGGKLTDTYDDIAGGIAVSEYALTTDAILALAKQAVPAGLPTVSAEDEGKVLTVSNAGEWAAEYVPAELPQVSATDNGDVLTVVEGEWTNAALPT